MLYAIVTPMQADFVTSHAEIPNRMSHIIWSAELILISCTLLQKFPHCEEDSHESQLLRHAVSQMNPVKLSVLSAHCPAPHESSHILTPNFFPQHPVLCHINPGPVVINQFHSGLYPEPHESSPLGSCPKPLNFLIHYFTPTSIISTHLPLGMYAMAQLDEALHYKPEGRRFDSRWGNGIFHRLDPSGLTMALGSTQPLTEISTEGTSWGGKGGRCVRADNLATFMCRIV